MEISRTFSYHIRNDEAQRSLPNIIPLYKSNHLQKKNNDWMFCSTVMFGCIKSAKKWFCISNGDSGLNLIRDQNVILWKQWAKPRATTDTIWSIIFERRNAMYLLVCGIRDGDVTAMLKLILVSQLQAHVYTTRVINKMFRQYII